MSTSMIKCRIIYFLNNFVLLYLISKMYMIKLTINITEGLRLSGFIICRKELSYVRFVFCFIEDLIYSRVIIFTFAPPLVNVRFQK